MHLHFSGRGRWERFRAPRSCRGIQEQGFKWAELQVPKEGKPGFTLLTPEQTGITFTNPLDERFIVTDRGLSSGSGLAIGDIYHDGLPAIFFANPRAQHAVQKPRRVEIQGC